MGFLVADIVVLADVIGCSVGEVDDAPNGSSWPWTHVMCIAVMTDSLFGVDAAAHHRRWSGVDGWVLGAVFAVGLLADLTVLTRIGAPVKGTAILVRIVTMAARILGSPGPEPAVAAAP